MMRTATWLLTPLFTLSLVACGDDGSGDDTTTSTTVPNPTTSTDGTTTEPTTTTDGTTTPDPTTTSTDPTTTSTDPTTTEPTTGDLTTGTTGDPLELSCTQYCDTYATACLDFSEYDNNEACLAQCAQWPLGIANETAGDSLGCRLYHVTVASTTMPELHCPHAGPSGAATCVSAGAPTCGDYCATYFGSCKDDLDLYKGDMAACMDACAEWYPGIKDAAEGDSIGCREYHAGVALGDPETHCPHAGPGGAMVCVTK